MARILTPLVVSCAVHRHESTYLELIPPVERAAHLCGAKPSVHTAE